MWEAIASNRRRSLVLISLMGLLLILLGFAIGITVDPRIGGGVGVLAALGVWLILWLTAAMGGRAIMLQTAGAHRIEKADSPRLWNVVEEMTIAAGLPAMPDVYVIEDDSLNAFAVGRASKDAAVAVTSGLLRRLTRDELQGVIGHEIGHIRNLDVRFMTMAAVMVGSIALLSDIFLRSLFYGGGRRRTSRSDGGGGGQAQIIILLVAVAVAILAPLCARLLYFACSRRREYLADASSARFTRFPEGLASALTKISHHAGMRMKSSRVVAPLYTVNPLQSDSALAIFSTHPPTALRIQVLRAMAGRAGLADYEAAYRQVQGEKGRCLGERTLASADSVTVREPSAEAEPLGEAVDRAREVAGLLGRIGQFLYIPCACGVNIKVPPEFDGPSVTCPHCGRVNPVPKAAEASAEKPGAPESVLHYERKGSGWESFRCSCGRVIQLSPKFDAPQTRCPGCQRKIQISPAKGAGGRVH